MTCQDLIALILDYLEGGLTPEDAAEFEAHLRDCPPCQAYLATYRKTKAVAGAAGRVEMPEEMKQRLREFLARRVLPKA